MALIVKMDDIGLAMAKRDSEKSQRFGEFLVRAMPSVLNVISIVGMFAMLWVGGHIILVGTAELGFTAPEELVHHLSEAVHHVAVVGPVLAWLVETVCALVLGVIWGAIIVGIVHVLPFGKKHDDDAASGDDAQGTAPRQDEGSGATAPAHGSDLGSSGSGSGSSAAQEPPAGR